MRSVRGLLAGFGCVIGLLAVLVLAALSSGTSRIDYAFVDGRSTPTVLSFTETPILFVVVVPIVCALLGWMTAALCTKRGWVLAKTDSR